jgi:hypothetical protein
MMNTIEKYYIYRKTKLNNQINDKLTVKPNHSSAWSPQGAPYYAQSAATSLTNSVSWSSVPVHSDTVPVHSDKDPVKDIRINNYVKYDSGIKEKS